MHPDEDYIPNHLVTSQLQEGDQLTGWTSETDMDYTTLDESEASFHTMSTIQSIEAADYFLFVHGFLYESGESVPRLFPSGASLDKRDLLLHMIFRLARGGTNVPPIVDQMLRGGGVDANRGAPKVLEIVTNSGAWVQEMAEIYPTTTLVSIDTKPLIAHKPHARIAYEVYDMCAGILEPECSFDLVYTKHTALTKDFNGLLREICRVLKPNGFLLMDVLPLDAYEGEDPGIPLHSAPQFAEGLRLLRAVWEKQGSDIGIWDDLGSRLDPAHPLWQNSQSLVPDPQGDATYPTRGFHSADLKIVTVPVGTWSNDERGRVLGELMRVFTAIAWRNFPPAMLMNGTEENEAQAIITGILQELRDIDRCKAYQKCQLWCAQKI